MSKDYRLTDTERHLFHQGTYYACAEKLGAHPAEAGGKRGFFFSVWAPGVKSVQVIGGFSGWSEDGGFMEPGTDGVWSLFVPDVDVGQLYKYRIATADGETLYKADPCGFRCEVRPGTASETADLSGYVWKDGAWISGRKNHFQKPLNIYEVHLGSWRRHEDGRFLSYRECADALVPYVKDMGYTHVELMPLTEFPFDGSWGYQVTGYFAPTSRYGTPQDFMYFVDRCHESGIGVILDWVPGHFCRDAHGLCRFNGKKLYESFEHKQWGTFNFDFGRPEVRSFLISSALYWIGMYHLDGIRVDGVSSMLYLNFGVDDPKEKRFNKKGTEENLEAVAFLQELNDAVGRCFPDVFTVAEESSAWPLVTYPPDKGGLGFHYKWDMGWMNDTLQYEAERFEHRRYRHNLLTFSMMYAFSENFILPLSHDEVVHGKKSLIGRMPGSYEQQFAGLRLLFLYQICHSGAKLTFMGNEIAQFIEWRFYEQLQWFLLDYDKHRQFQGYVRRLNHLFLEQPALWSENYSWNGFQWMDADNSAQSVLIFSRTGADGDRCLAVLNFSDTSYPEYRIGVPETGFYKELLNTDAAEFGGEMPDSIARYKSEPVPMHGQKRSVSLRLPALSGILLKCDRKTTKKSITTGELSCSQTKKNSNQPTPQN